MSQLTSGSFAATRNVETQLGRTTFSEEDDMWQEKQNEYEKKALELVETLERELDNKKAALRGVMLGKRQPVTGLPLGHAIGLRTGGNGRWERGNADSMSQRNVETELGRTTFSEEEAKDRLRVEAEHPQKRSRRSSLLLECHRHAHHCADQRRQLRLQLPTEVLLQYLQRFLWHLK